MGLIEIYGTNDCAYCKRAVKVCEANNLEYKYHNISDDPNLMTEMFGRMGTPLRQVPQIFIDGEYHPGGYEAFARKVASE